MTSTTRSHAEFWNVYLWGGDGNDALTLAGEGNAVFNGGPGDDRMTGGEGRSLFLERSGPNGSDVMAAGSFSSDTVSYAHRTGAVQADLEGDADDGEAGEHDQIGSDVESITGGAGPDVLTGNAVSNALLGGHGADRLRSGAGNDVLDGGVNADLSSDRLVAGTGEDYVTGGGGNDFLYGGLGNDNVRGGPGRDRVRPGPGRDQIAGGPGNDMLWALDRRGEDVECGGGWDTVLADSSFDSLEDCERDLSRARRR